MMMQRKNRIYKWLVMLWLLLAGGVWSPMAAYTRVAQPLSTWQKQPTMSADICPSYQFHSTSSYTLVVGQTSYTAEPYNPLQASGPSRARKNNPWDDTNPTDLGVGEVDDPAPVGEPLVLLWMVILYFLYTKRKKIQEKFAQFKKKQ